MEGRELHQIPVTAFSISWQQPFLWWEWWAPAYDWNLLSHHPSWSRSDGPDVLWDTAQTGSQAAQGRRVADACLHLLQYLLYEVEFASDVVTSSSLFLKMNSSLSLGVFRPQLVSCHGTFQFGFQRRWGSFFWAASLSLSMSLCFTNFEPINQRHKPSHATLRE